MLKKLRKRIYNKKAAKELKDIVFDNFAYCGDSEFPMFVKRGTQYTNHKFYLPQTDEAFTLAFNKLSSAFFHKYVLDDVKNKIRVYMAHFNISEDAYDYCVDKFKVKAETVKNF